MFIAFFAILSNMGSTPSRILPQNICPKTLRPYGHVFFWVATGPRPGCDGRARRPSPRASQGSTADAWARQPPPQAARLAWPGKKTLRSVCDDLNKYLTVWLSYCKLYMSSWFFFSSYFLGPFFVVKSVPQIIARPEAAPRSRQTAVCPSFRWLPPSCHPQPGEPS